MQAVSCTTEINRKPRRLCGRALVELNGAQVCPHCDKLPDEMVDPAYRPSP